MITVDSSCYHDSLIILHFRRYASGNFLANILSHNREFVPKFRFNGFCEISRQRTKILKMSDEELFTTQLAVLKTTLPPNKAECRNWSRYELSCADFWAKDYDTFLGYQKNIDFDKWAANFEIAPYCLMQRQKRCFIVMHYYHWQRYFLKMFPKATLLQIVNDERTVAKGIELKAPKDYMNWAQPPNPVLDNVLHFDIDSIWDRDKFFENVDSLLEKLNVKDKTLDSSVYDYYNRYINLYSDL